MEKQRGIKALSIVALLVAVVGLTVAFAAMSRTLTINGTATMDTAKWDIHFENLSAPTTTGKATSTMPQTDGTKIGDYSVTVTRPGDSVTYTFDVKNDGDINATLGTWTWDEANLEFTGTGDSAEADAALVKGNMTYTLTYDDGSAVNIGDTLNAGETKTLKLYIAYNEGAETLPKADVTITSEEVTMVYNQAD